MPSVGLKKNVITRFESKTKFLSLLQHNPGICILKVGASWCKPCQQIKAVVDAFFASSPNNVICADIDIVDKSNEDLYMSLKKKIRMQGIPCILMYKAGNSDLVPDEMVTGTEPAKLHYFFTRCGQHLNTIEASLNNISKQI